MPDNENKGINEGADISGIFKGLSTKPPPREFRLERAYPETPKIIQWTMKYSGGLIKNEKQAQYAILGFVVAAIIISLFLFFSGGETPKIRLEEFINKPQFLP